jgi:hypothetical protein
MMTFQGRQLLVVKRGMHTARRRRVRMLTTPVCVQRCSGSCSAFWRACLVEHKRAIRCAAAMVEPKNASDVPG